MRHSAIASTAIAAVTAAAQHLVDADVGSFAEQSQLERLYDYARERKFPQPETLARKAGELIRDPFPFVSINAAPEALQVFYTTFRAVAHALEPFHEDDPEEIPTDMDIPTPDSDPAHTTEAAQQQMDAAIAESGGKFSEPAPAVPDTAQPDAPAEPEAATEKTKKKTK
jgi:hypothetical protein